MYGTGSYHYRLYINVTVCHVTSLARKGPQIIAYANPAWASLRDTFFVNT
jgi:hypothetical protein